MQRYSSNYCWVSLRRQRSKLQKHIFCRLFLNLLSPGLFEIDTFRGLFLMFSLCVSVVSAGSEVSQNAEVDLSCSGLTELDIGADEVFIVSSATSPSGLPFSPLTVRPTFMSGESVCLSVCHTSVACFSRTRRI